MGLDAYTGTLISRGELVAGAVVEEYEGGRDSVMMARGMMPRISKGLVSLGGPGYEPRGPVDIKCLTSTRGSCSERAPFTFKEWCPVTVRRH